MLQRPYPAAESESISVRDAIWTKMGAWRSFIVAIDGVDGAGKSTLGRYLAWQLGMPLVESDQYLVQNTGKLDYRNLKLKRLIASQNTS